MDSVLTQIVSVNTHDADLNCGYHSWDMTLNSANDNSSISNRSKLPEPHKEPLVKTCYTVL